MTSTDTDRLAEIAARADAATEGHWYPISIEFRGQVSHSVKSAAGSVLAHTGYGPKGGSCHANAEFMAHARSDVPFLLSLVEQLQGQLDAAIEEIDQLRDQLAEQQWYGEQLQMSVDSCSGHYVEIEPYDPEESS